MQSEKTYFRLKIVISCLLLAILILFGVQLYMSQEFATATFDVSSLQKRIDTMDAANERLREEIITNESYLVIASRAAQMGFKDAAENTIYLK